MTPSSRLASESPDDSGPSTKRYQSNVDSKQSIKVYIVQTKLDSETVDELYSLIERSRLADHSPNSAFPEFSLCGDVAEADVIVTNIRMRRRLERHLDWQTARQKSIVTPQWLRDSIQRRCLLSCADYAALRELHEEALGTRNPVKKTLVLDRFHMARAGDSETSVNHLSHMARYACARASPLVCPNQDLVAELGVLCQSRDLEGKTINALGYERAIAVIKAYPYPITLKNLETEVSNLPYLGEKTLSKIKEFLEGGTIKESQTILGSERFKAISTFITVYGIGPATARDLYSTGLRTMEDMKRFYDVPDTANPLGTLENGSQFTPNGRKIPGKPGLPEITIPVALALRNDLQTKIPRAEVEEMHEVVMSELETLRHGCISTIVGGYRRGKLESNDVDIVITHPDLQSGGDQVKGLRAKLVRRLYDKGLVTHVMHLSNFRTHDALRTSHWDSLEKALTVFILPTNDKGRRIHRRLDLIFAVPEAYWTAVVGWTGSRMFERDLRLWAKVEKGMKFDSSGLVRRNDSRMFYPKGEREVFYMLGLEWVEPTLRNANI